MERPRPISWRPETASQKNKLRTMAATLKVSQNKVLCRLIDNAEIGDVVRQEPVAIVPGQNAQCITGK